MAKNSISGYLHIGENMKRERKAAGYTQREFAQLLGIPVSTYSNYENGNRDPGPETLKKIAAALGIPLDRLLSVSDQVADLAKEENRGLLEQVAEELAIPASHILSAIRNKENYAVYPILDKVAEIVRKSTMRDTVSAISKLIGPEEEQDRFISDLVSLVWDTLFRNIEDDVANLLVLSLQMLNADGQRKALAYVQDLTKIPEYQKPREEQEKENQKAEQEAPNGETHEHR